jgi:hypothetical protein
MNWRFKNIKEDWLDFRTLAGIQKRTGIRQDELLETVVKELVDNSLDECGACELVTTSRGFYVQDKGEGIPGSDDDIAHLFSIKRPRISTKNLRLPKRGCLGEGLRLCAAVSLNLNYEIEVSTRGRTLKLEPLSSGYTKHKVTGSYQEPGTRVEICCGNDINWADNGRGILTWGKLAIEMARGRDYSGKSSPFWYDSAFFDEFLTTLELPDNYSLTRIIEEAFGLNDFTHSNDSVKKILNKKVLELTIQDKDMLLAALREEAKIISPRLNGNVDPALLGNVGAIPGYDFYSSRTGVYRYTGNEGSLDAEIPFVVEIWGKRPTYLSNARIFINKSPVMEYVHCWSDEKQLKLSGCGIEEKFPAEAPLDLRINIITPYVPLSSNSKKPDLKEMTDTIHTALEAVIKQSNKAYEDKYGNLKKRTFILTKESSGVSEAKIDDISHQNIKKMAKNMKVKVTDLIALAPKNDPFYIGTRNHKIVASWFKQWWYLLGYYKGKKAHLRRMHYQILSTQSLTPQMHDNTPYLNTDKCWEYLCDASRYARLLGLVDPALIIDKRNPAPVYPELNSPCDPLLTIEPFTWKLPVIPQSLKDTFTMDIPEFQIEGYEYYNYLQSYHLEIWCEKSTMDDILDPLCKQYSVTLRNAIGFFTMTRVVELVGDILRINKPVRIFYISDFDPAGVNMPVAVARQIEFWLKQLGNKTMDVKLHHMLLTRGQAIKYKLPRIPIKDSDRRKSNFEDKFGTGAVELDALEALHPGEFKNIVENNILQYFDTELEEKVNDIKKQALTNVKSQWKETINPYINELDAIKSEIQNITAGYEEKLKSLNASMDKELSSYKERVEELQNAVKDDIENIKSKIEIPDIPQSDLKEDDNEWLFDSKRDYLSQLKYYKRSQTKKSDK